MPSVPFTSPALLPTAKSAAPGTTFATTVVNPGHQPMQVLISTMTLTRETDGHCGLSSAFVSVPWAKADPSAPFTLPPGGERAVSVHVASHGPPGGHDLIVGATHIAPANPGHSNFSATGGYQVAVTYPGRPVTASAPCTYAARHVKTVPVKPAVVVHQAASPWAGIGVLVALALVVAVLARVWRRRRLSHNNGRHAK